MIPALLLLASAFAAPPKPTVVMIHGAGGGGWEYRFWREPFEKAGWTVVAPDLMPVAGGLAKTRFEDYASQTLAVARGEPLVLIGASMGGVLALKAAERLSPKAIVLVNSVPPKGIPYPRPDQDVPDIVEWAGGPWQDTVDAMPDSDRSTRLFAHRRWRDESGAVLRAMRDGIDVARPRCRVLVVVGEADTDIPPETSRTLAEKLGADVFSYAGMSHVGPLLSTRATEVAQQVLAWVEERR